MPALTQLDPEPIDESHLREELKEFRGANTPFPLPPSKNRNWFGLPKASSSTVFQYLSYVHKYSTLPYLSFIPLHLVNVLILPTALTLLSFSKEDKYETLNDYFQILKELNSLLKFNTLIIGGLSLHVVSGIILNQWRRYRRSKFVKKQKHLLHQAEIDTTPKRSWIGYWKIDKNFNYNAISGRIAVPLIMYHLYLVKGDGLSSFGFNTHETGIMETLSQFIHSNFWMGTLPFIGLIGMVLYHTMFGVSRYFNKNRLNPTRIRSKGWYLTIGAVLTGIACLKFV